jgi:electron transfer flavoprotein alpha subunit
MGSSLYSIDDQAQAIWVYLEHTDGNLENVSLEMLSEGRLLADQMGWPLVALLLGHDIEDMCQEAFTFGADQVSLAEHMLLEDFTIEGYTSVIYQILLQSKPSVVLLGATHNGRDLAGRLAVRLRTGLNADCTGLRINPDTGVLICEVSGFGGGVLALIEMQSHRPQMATVRPGVFSLREMTAIPSKTIVRPNFNIQPRDIYTKYIERFGGGDRIDLTGSPVLVAGGRGIDGDFQMLEELAQLINGEIGATRPPVDDGYIERERQIGQTGVVCSPKLAVCCGISGAFHFVVGIEKADTVIAINKDPKAPIFTYADYCIVADVKQIIPQLINALR